MPRTFDDLVSRICEEDPRYPPEAYGFVLEALSFTQKKLKRGTHVTGKELLEGIKLFLLEQFGPMTMTVLNHWGIHTTEDFGHIVFNLVERKILSKTDEDSLEHFKNVYDFDQVFYAGYRRRLERQISRLR